jgi:hypothetical protein
MQLSNAEATFLTHDFAKSGDLSAKRAHCRVCSARDKSMAAALAPLTQQVYVIWQFRRQ